MNSRQLGPQRSVACLLKKVNTLGVVRPQVRKKLFALSPLPLYKYIYLYMFSYIFYIYIFFYRFSVQLSKHMQGKNSYTHRPTHRATRITHTRSGTIFFQSYFHCTADIKQGKPSIYLTLVLFPCYVVVK